MAITRPDQVWSSDITYVPLRHGFMYLVAVMDWYSRYVLQWRLSNTLDGQLLPGGARRSARAGRRRRSSTAIKGASSRPRRSRRGWNRGRGDQHGWPRPSDRQRVHRAAVAEREVRGGVPAATTRTAGRPRRRWRRTSASTTTSESTRRSATARRPKFIAIEAQAAGSRRTKNELKSRTTS